MRSSLIPRGLAATVAVATLCAGVLQAQVTFSDQTLAAGLVHQTDMFYDMTAGGMYPGGTAADFNRDGWIDLFLVGGGHAADALFLNNGDGTFTDRASDWGFGPAHRGRGTTAGDFNGDGWPDLYVTSGGPVTGPDSVGMHRLYRNNGDGSFTDIAASAGVTQSSPTNTDATGAAFGDYDLDGDLDLFVCNWEGMDGNRLYRNNGDETFTDVTVSAGIDPAFNGFSPRFVDMNGDRYPELLVAADFGTSRYFGNDGDGTFTDRTVSSGTGLDENGMGTTVGDFNRDGLADWYVSSIYAPPARVGNFVYINQGDHLFVDLPASAGGKNGGWGWGTEAVDFDHDGWIDLIEANGWNNQYENIPVFLYRNNGDLTFTDVQVGSGLEHAGQGRTVLTLDYDRDGDMDVVITSFNEPVALYRNDLSGPNTNWIEVRLDTSGDPTLCPDGYGAKVVATTTGGSQYFWINGGSSYLGRGQPIAHFGLNDATIVDLTVEWTNGATTVATGVAANQILVLGPPIAGAPGESSGAGSLSQMVARYNQTTGRIDVAYAPSCEATNHTIYYGDLSDVANYLYAGAACWLGNSGSTSIDPAGVSDAFFLIVGNSGTVEGSYGTDGAGLERPEDLSTDDCDLAQDLSGICDLP